jgi:hypothetical protein
MPRNRPDFAEHLARLGLDASADDLSILGRSGGGRATDSLEMFPLPFFDSKIACFQTYFWVHGFRHLTPEQQARVVRLQPGEPLQPMTERANARDPHAIQLFTGDSVFAGYIPRYLAGDACQMLKVCSLFEVSVARANADPAPSQQRLLCRLLSCWPDDFKPCNEDCYQPIPTEALKVDPCTGVIVSAE